MNTQTPPETNERPTPPSRSCSIEIERFLQHARSGVALPFPGYGKTARRFDSLRAESANDASVGRLIEAHQDALAILDEASVAPPPGRALAVWASGPLESLRLTRTGDVNVLSGRRSFCGGASIVDAALVLCASEQGEQIVLVDLLDPNVHVAPSTWTANAFRNAAVRTVHFDQYVIGADRFIGPPNWYGARPGFWFGAVGVTALWAGLADALLHYLPDLQRRSDSTSDLARATIETSMWAVSATLSYVAECIDGSRNRVPAHTNSKLDAVSARIAMRAHIDSVTKYFDQEIGPAPYATQPALAQLRNELALALSQHHGTRELSALQHRT